MMPSMILSVLKMDRLSPSLRLTNPALLNADTDWNSACHAASASESDTKERRIKRATKPAS